MIFSAEQTERYSRHFALNEIGILGQEKLKNAKILVIGAGGLGSPAAMYLAAAGVGTIGIADADCVELSNLQRQILHHDKNIGMAKTASAKAALENLNPDTKVITFQVFVDETNIEKLIGGFDFVLDCTDSAKTKFIINDSCARSKKPFCHAGVIRFGGQLMTYIPQKSSCLRCIFKDPPNENDVPKCRDVGVIGAACGVIGSLQALEAIKYIAGAGGTLDNELLTFDGLRMNFRKIKLPPPDENCPSCGK